MLKALIWCVTLIGLLPVVSLVLIEATMLVTEKATAEKVRAILPAAPEGSLDTYMHDAFVTIGPLRMTLYPRIWALVLAAIGIACIVVSLIFVLHVP